MITKEIKVKKSNKGGARPGAGRPKTSPDNITIKGLLEEVKKQSKSNYEQILIEDFLKARNDNDRNLTVKYHNLLLSKLMVSLAKIEVTDSQESLEQKQIAFADALAKLTGVKSE